MTWRISPSVNPDSVSKRNISLRLGVALCIARAEVVCQDKHPLIDVVAVAIKRFFDEGETFEHTLVERNMDAQSMLRNSTETPPRAKEYAFRPAALLPANIES